MDFLQIAQSLGVPLACLAGLAYAVWSVLKWIKPLAEGWVARQIKFLDDLTSVLGSLEVQMTNQTNELRDIHHDITTMKGLVVRADKVVVQSAGVQTPSGHQL